ncbi:MAG: SDR family NAD(P)-dependent oxidoreductase [Desulfobacterales bacterium]|nr:SDR family NAD(P)-dependent oxidoreductase [Desulfobacterales bacterium]
MSDGKELKDKVAVVTGSGQGLGRAFAVAFAEAGAKVITNSRKPGTEGGDAGTTAEQIRGAGGQAEAVFGDVSSFSDAGKLIQTAIDKFGRIDILVNNAGVDSPKMVWKMEEVDWDKCLNATLKGAFNCSRFACAAMKEQNWGRIIMNTSTAWLGTVGHVNYGAAKAGIVGLTRAIAREMGRFGVTCNAFTPMAATRMTDNEAVKAGLKKRFDSGLITRQQYEDAVNMPPPEAVAPMLVYLASEKAANINGQVFHLEGGKIGYYSEPVQARVVYKDIKEGGYYTQAELDRFIPQMLSGIYTNPAPKA